MLRSLDEHASESQDSPCVLVVEDDPLTQARLELLLETAGLAAVSVPSAEKARAALAAVFFPIVIVDRMLEDGDGIALCSEVRQQHLQSRVYLILLSALDSAADIATGLAAGADAYMSKRAPDHELLEKLARARRIIALPPK
jgi:DNA-binding response OmpR family regulator